MKKVFAMILVLVMMLALSVTALAEVAEAYGLTNVVETLTGLGYAEDSTYYVCPVRPYMYSTFCCKKIEAFGDSFTSAGQMFMPASMAVAELGAAAVKTNTYFDTSMSKAEAVSGATGDNLDALRDKAREMGAKTKFSASEAADAMNYMAMAGWKKEAYSQSTGCMLYFISNDAAVDVAEGFDLREMELMPSKAMGHLVLRLIFFPGEMLSCIILNVAHIRAYTFWTRLWKALKPLNNCKGKFMWNLCYNRHLYAAFWRKAI